MIKVIISLIFIFGAYSITNAQGEEKSERFKRGWQKLKEIDGEAGEKVVESLHSLAPDFGDYVIEYAFGDVYCRDGISDLEREVAVIASLTAMGNARPQLKVHLHASLNVGLSPEEIIEVLCHVSPYAGIPASLNALAAFKEVMNERGITISQDRTNTDAGDIYKLGSERLNSISAGQPERLQKAFGSWAPEIVDYIFVAFGSIYNLEKLSKKLRLFSNIAALTAMGTAALQLKFYIKASLDNGITVDELKEVMITMSVYSGFPSTLNGLFLLKDFVKNDEEG